MRIFSWPHWTDGEADSERLKMLCCVRIFTAYKKASQDSKIDLPNSKNETVSSLVLQWLGHYSFTAKSPGLTLVRELGYHKLHGAAKKQHKKQIV